MSQSVKVWCVIDSNGIATDVSASERGAKMVATRHGYPAIGWRNANHYYVAVTHRKVNGRWVAEGAE